MIDLLISWKPDWGRNLFNVGLILTSHIVKEIGGGVSTYIICVEPCPGWGCKAVTRVTHHAVKFSDNRLIQGQYPLGIKHGNWKSYPNVGFIGKSSKYEGVSIPEVLFPCCWWYSLSFSCWKMLKASTFEGHSIAWPFDTLFRRTLEQAPRSPTSQTSLGSFSWKYHKKFGCLPVDIRVSWKNHPHPCLRMHQNWGQSTNNQSSKLLPMKISEVQTWPAKHRQVAPHSSTLVIWTLPLSWARPPPKGHRGIRWWMLRANLDSICLKGKKGLCQGHILHSLLSLERT